MMTLPMNNKIQCIKNVRTVFLREFGFDPGLKASMVFVEAAIQLKVDNQTDQILRLGVLTVLRHAMGPNRPAICTMLTRMNINFPTMSELSDVYLDEEIAKLKTLLGIQAPAESIQTPQYQSSTKF